MSRHEVLNARDGEVSSEYGVQGTGPRASDLPSYRAADLAPQLYPGVAFHAPGAAPVPTHRLLRYLDPGYRLVSYGKCRTIVLVLVLVLMQCAVACRRQKRGGLHHAGFSREVVRCCGAD